jgi:hypothetical protein
MWPSPSPGSTTGERSGREGDYEWDVEPGARERITGVWLPRLDNLRNWMASEECRELAMAV